uniref:Cna B-type domain-containing protein n=1 Tax=Vaginimicrobium propionicum TaxID=1871034 RepID=UPI0009704B36|nr:Cna B-type domain-containing protein [Vaginimicrobium propionicum]
MRQLNAYSGTITISGGTIKENDNDGLTIGGAVGVWGSKDNRGALNIQGGEIANNKIENPHTSGLGGATFAVFTDVTITGGNVHDNFTENGGAFAFFSSSLNMSGGTVQNNHNNMEYSGTGGAMLLESVEAEISGGTFQGNTGSDDGGGAIRANNSDLHITGGNFTENECWDWGGAIHVNGGTVTIDGGSFVGNTASASGGALSLSGGTKKYDGAQGVINAGYFANNTAKGWYGGGAIFNDNNSKLTINDALVRNNSIKDARIISAGGHPASAQGGGVWNCPFGTSVLNITRGVAIFDNDAYNAGSDGSFKGAGDDFLGVTEHLFNEPSPVKGQPVKISERMLGGGQRLWYQDGSVYGIRSNWDEARQLPRYQEGGENTRIPYNTEIKDHIAFKSVPSDDSKKLAEKLARVVIENNSATTSGFSGGGIGNNGLLTFGEPEKWEVFVKKDWQGDDPASRPTKVTLDVLVGGFKVDEITLSVDTDWAAKLENFPNPATLIDAQTGKKLPITFKEHGMDGYTLVISDESADVGTKIYTISLVNKMTTEVSVNKKWSDSFGTCEQPNAVQVELLANGKPSGSTLELNADNSWTARFADLPKYDDGKIVDYSVSEIAVKNYKSVVSGDAEHGFTVTNTCTRPKRLPRTGLVGAR